VSIQHTLLINRLSGSGKVVEYADAVFIGLYGSRGIFYKSMCIA